MNKTEVFEGVEPGGLRGQELEGVKEHGAPGEHKSVPASHQLAAAPGPPSQVDWVQDQWSVQTVNGGENKEVGEQGIVLEKGPGSEA